MSRPQDPKTKDAIARWKFLVERAVYIDMWVKSVPQKKIRRRPIENKEISELTPKIKHDLNIPLELRKEQQRRDLAETFAQIRSLTDLPPLVRARMSRVARYKEMKIGYDIITEKKDPVYVYFLIAGKVECTKQVFNKLYGRFEKQRGSVSIYGAGSCVGYHEILLNIKREYTITALTDVELVYMFIDDYMQIVYPFMKRSWDMRRTAIECLPYFKDFTENQIIEACKLSVLQQFDMYDLIYTKDEGMLSNTYFVLSGECMIVQVLKVQTKSDEVDPTIKTYKLLDFKKKKRDGISMAASDESLLRSVPSSTLPFTEDDIDKVLKMNEEKPKFDIRTVYDRCGLAPPEGILETIDQPPMEQVRLDKAVTGVFYRTLNVSRSADNLGVQQDLNLQVVRQLMKPAEQRKREKEYTKKMTVEDLLKKIARKTKPLLEQKIELLSEKISPHKVSKKKLKEFPSWSYFGEEEGFHSSYSLFTSMTSDDEVLNAIDILGSGDISSHNSQMLLDIIEHNPGKLTEILSESRMSLSRRSNMSKVVTGDKERQLLERLSALLDDGDSDSTDTFESVESYEEEDDDSFDKMRYSTDSDIFERHSEIHLVDVGVVRLNGIFGLGEKIEQRYILARTNVQCLLLPRFWLFAEDQNPSQVWQSRLKVLQMSIPTREKVFEFFVAEQNWPQFKRKVVEEILDNPETKINHTKYQDLPGMLRYT